MNNWMRLSFVLFGVFVLNSCAPDPVALNIEQHDPQIVVASQILNNETMVVALTNSQSGLLNMSDSNNTFDKFVVNDAIVVIEHDGKVDSLLPNSFFPAGFYVQSAMGLSDYSTVNLRVNDPQTNRSVHSSTQVLPKIDFDTVTTNELNDSTLSLTYTFTDAPGQSNWYLAVVYDFDSTINDTVTAGGLVKIMFERKKKSASQWFIYSDKDIGNGKQISNTVEVKKNDYVLATLSNISSAYYEYLLIRQESKGRSFVFSEPRNYPTNVVGGFGYFNAHNTALRLKVL